MWCLEGKENERNSDNGIVRERYYTVPRPDRMTCEY